MTGRWWTRTAAARRLDKTLPEIEDLIASDTLHLESIVGDHEVISEESIERYEREHADTPAVGRWSRAEDPESFAERGDYDTPNDEGEHA